MNGHSVVFRRRPGWRSTVAVIRMVGLALLVMTFTATKVLSFPSTTGSMVAAETHVVEYSPKTALVRFKPGMMTAGRPVNAASASSLSQLLQALGATSVVPLFEDRREPVTTAQAGSEESELARIYRIQWGTEIDVEQAVAALNRNPAVEYAEPDYLARPATMPDDPLFSQQGWATTVQLPNAWEYTTGALTVTIAIVDSGIDLDHPDLQGRLWLNPGEIAGNGLDDDNNGYIDDLNGWDFLYASSSLQDENGHGTEVAGVAAATGANGQGISGVCWGCRIMPVKVMQPTGIVNYSDLARGIAYAAAKGAHVINLSLGGYANSRTLHTVIQSAAQSAVIVAGAGNDGTTTPFYPAAYPEVLAVAAIDAGGQRATFSNHGDWVDVVAPGVDVLTTFDSGTWGAASGTSLAAPVVSGVAGLVKTQHPDWTPAQVAAQVRQTASPVLEPGLGAGLVDATRAVQLAQPAFALDGYALNGESNGFLYPNRSGQQLVLQVSNIWGVADNVQGQLSSPDATVTVNEGAVSLGGMATGVTVNSPPFRFDLGAAPHNNVVPFVLTLTSGAFTQQLAFTLPTAMPQVAINVPIATNMTWTADHTYVISGDVPINAGTTLTIQPGVMVRFAADASLTVNGTLVADGTETQPIRLVADTPESVWNRVQFADSSTDAATDAEGVYSGGSILRHVVLQASRGGVQCSGASPYLAFLTSATAGIRCTPGVATLWVQDNVLSGGVYVTGGTLNVRRNILSGQGIVATGAANVHENRVTGAGISVSGGRVEANQVAGGSIGLGNNSVAIGNVVRGGGVSGGSNVTVQENHLEGGGIFVGQNAVVMTNTVQFAPGAGLTTGPNVLAQANRMLGNRLGIVATTGQVRRNLIADSIGPALQVQGHTLQSTQVISNSFTGNLSTTLIVGGISAINLKIEGNNFENNRGAYDLQVALPWGQQAIIPANRNWWNTTVPDTIAIRVYDFNDNATLARVTYVNPLNDPDETAPAYVRSVDIEPVDVIGIERGTFVAQFSRPMNTTQMPSVTFATANRGQWRTFITADGLPADTVRAAAIDLNGMAWFGTDGGAAAYINDRWQRITTAEGLPHSQVNAVAADLDGSMWFGTPAGAAMLSGGQWTTYTVADGQLPADDVLALAVDANRAKWIGTTGGVAWFDGATWMTYTQATSGLPADQVVAVAPAPDGSVWFGTPAGAARYDGLGWSVYSTANAGLPANNIQAITVAPDGVAWFGTDAGLARYDGATWTIYTDTIALVGLDVHSLVVDVNNVLWVGAANGLASYDGVAWRQVLGLGDLRALAADPWGRKWAGLAGTGVGLYHDSPDYVAQADTGWRDAKTYAVGYDFTAMMLKGPYSITVGSAVGGDGLPTVASRDATFQVDYASFVTDYTPPVKPQVRASSSGALSSLDVEMSATDADSSVRAYRYAIGTQSTRRDVVEWAPVTGALAAASDGTIQITRSGLALIPGQSYFVQVQAQNATGLWSQAGVSNPIVAGETLQPPPLPDTEQKLYLPAVLR